jgi:hypothetical protein
MDIENGHKDMKTWRHGKRKTGNGSQAIFLKPCTVCSSCKCKLVFFQFVDEEIKGSYPYANDLNRLNGLVHQ